MKRSIHSFCAVIGIVTALTSPSLFAVDSIEEVIETLHQAEKATGPVPLLQKAMDDYKHYNPKTGSWGHIAANRATAKHKEAALARLQEAIDLATDAKSPSEKITAAISEMRLSAEFKH